jgi:hypothetical protein
VGQYTCSRTPCKRLAYVKRRVRSFQGITSRNVSGETEEEGLSRELERPDTDFLYPAFAHSAVVEDIAGEGIVHLSFG